MATKKKPRTSPGETPPSIRTVVDLLEKTRELYLEYPDWLWLCLLHADDDENPDLFGYATELIEDALATCWLITWDGEYADGIAALQTAIDNAGVIDGNEDVREC